MNNEINRLPSSVSKVLAGVSYDRNEGAIFIVQSDLGLTLESHGVSSTVDGREDIIIFKLGRAKVTVQGYLEAHGR